MLTEKQEKFVIELLKGKSQREAYKASYNAANMKDKTIDDKASLLWRKEEIRARYEELRGEMMKDDLEDAASIRRLIIEQETAILKTHLGDLVTLDIAEDGVSMVAVPRPENIRNFDMRAVQELKYDSRGNLVLKLYDKQAAINTLRELYGIANEEGDKEINIILHSAEGYDA